MAYTATSWVSGAVLTAAGMNKIETALAAAAGVADGAIQTSSSSAFGRTLLGVADAATARNALNAPSWSVSVTGGTGLTGGGNLTANQTISLSAASIASLALADSSLQPSLMANSQLLARGGTGTVGGASYGTAATAFFVVQRDADGQIVAPTPTSTIHAANKSYVDTAVGTKVSTSAVGASQVWARNSTNDATIGVTYGTSASASMLVQRNGSGQIATPTPSATTDAANKDYVDTGLAGKAATSHTHTASQISDSSTSGRTLLTTSDLGVARATINAADAGISITPGSGLTGGGNLTANRTLSLSAASVASLAKADNAVASDGNILRVLKITSAAYTALGTKDANTLYVIVG